MWLLTDITPVAPLAGQSFLRFFEGYPALLAAFQNVYLYIVGRVA